MEYSNTNRVPSISYPDTEHYTFEDDVPHSDVNYSQWPPQSRRSAQHLATSPTVSTQGFMTMSSPNVYHPLHYQGNLSPTQMTAVSNLIPDNTLLAPPGQFPQLNYNPIERQMQDQPWSSQNPRTINTGGSRSPSIQPSMQYRSFRDPGSNVDGGDSAYFSQSQPAQSILSNDPDCYNQDISPSVTIQVERMRVGSPAAGTHTMVRTLSDARSQNSSRSARSGKSSKQIKCAVPKCGVISNCMSEHKKHVLRHDKPFKCEELNCKRDGEGFTTTNDLERHRKSVHHIGLGAGSYQCASKQCKNPSKIWPRLDNFKQHIERMHKDEDHIDLIKLSEFQQKEQPAGFESLTVAPADTTSYDVAGMDRSLSGNSVMDNVSPMDITMVGHDPNQWTSWDMNAQNLANHASHMPTSNLDPIPRRVSSGPYRMQERASDQRKLSHDNSQQSLNVPGRRPSQARSSAATHQKLSSGPPPVLSNAPQTKAEQQRSALSKLSQAVSTATSSPVNLEAFLINMLHQEIDSAKWDNKPARKSSGEQDDSETRGFTKSDALHAVQAISNLIKQSPGASSARTQRRMTQGFVSNAKLCPFLECGFAVARECDLRKHMKRHARPYGCTYPKCYKRFGAKSDYKRHENSQHFQLEAWRCSQPGTSGKPCGAHFFRVVQYEQHLQEQHKGELSQEQIKQLLVKNRIGKNCQVRFWCGFCNAIIELHQKRNAAWDERFNHIADHFDRETKSIDDWICVEENKPKKELCKGMDRYVFDEEEDNNIDAEGEDDDAPPSPPRDVPTVPVQRPSEFAPPPPPAQAYPQINGGKRKAPGELQAPVQRQQRRRTERIKTVVNRYCCGCGGGPCGPFEPDCVTCSHTLCEGCHFVTEAAGGIDISLLQ